MVVVGRKIVWCFSHEGRILRRFLLRGRCEVDVDLGLSDIGLLANWVGGLDWVLLGGADTS